MNGTVKPNIVFILMDNLGYGEVGCYGGGILRGAPTPRKIVAEFEASLKKHAPIAPGTPDPYTPSK